MGQHPSKDAKELQEENDPPVNNRRRTMARTPLMRHNKDDVAQRVKRIMENLESSELPHSKPLPRNREGSDAAGGPPPSENGVFKSDIVRRTVDAHSGNVEREVLSEEVLFGTDRDAGLTTSEAERRLDIFGTYK